MNFNPLSNQSLQKNSLSIWGFKSPESHCHFLTGTKLCWHSWEVVLQLFHRLCPKWALTELLPHGRVWGWTMAWLPGQLQYFHIFWHFFDNHKIPDSGSWTPSKLYFWLALAYSPEKAEDFLLLSHANFLIPQWESKELNSSSLSNSQF